MSHRVPSAPLWWCVALIPLSAWMLVSAPMAEAQCARHPGDFLVGEDEDNYYCESPASSTDIGEALRDIEKYLTSPPQIELLGARGRFRKSAVDTAGCVARNHAAYGFGAKYSVLAQCSNGNPIDCSGLAGYAYRVSACFVRGFYSAANDVMRPIIPRPPTLPRRRS
jgi:hypothetical protein